MLLSPAAASAGPEVAVFANERQNNRLCVVGPFPCADVSADANVTFGVALGEVTAVSGSLSDVVSPYRVICRNLTSGQTISGLVNSGEWSCDGVGLERDSGDEIQILLRGTAE